MLLLWRRAARSGSLGHSCCHCSGPASSLRREATHLHREEAVSADCSSGNCPFTSHILLALEPQTHPTLSLPALAQSAASFLESPSFVSTFAASL